MWQSKIVLNWAAAAQRLLRAIVSLSVLLSCCAKNSVADSPTSNFWLGPVHTDGAAERLAHLCSIHPSTLGRSGCSPPEAAKVGGPRCERTDQTRMKLLTPQLLT